MVSIPIKPRCDENGMFARACPACGRYFRMKLGTGLPDQSECHCPYCRHLASHTKFWVRNQFKKAPSTSTAGGEQVLIPIMPRGRTEPLKAYPESDLEEALRCEDCALEYSVYGIFANCPDCGVQNTRQIFKTNLSVTGKLLKLAERETAELRDRLVQHCLDDAISAFDGFGRASFSGAHRNLSFQDIQAARDTLHESSRLDIAASISSRDWAFVRNQFQIRQLNAQKAGVIDAAFAKAAGMPVEAIGRNVKVSAEDVSTMISILARIADAFPN